MDYPTALQVRNRGNGNQSEPRTLVKLGLVGKVGEGGVVAFAKKATIRFFVEKRFLVSAIETAKQDKRKMI